MERLDGLIKYLNSFESEVIQIIKSVILENKELIEEMNSEDQLYEKGINRLGIPLSDFAPYSAITVEMKREKGQITSWVTLRDEGDFHKSITVIVKDTEFELIATDEKTDKLIRKYGKQILGLSDENFNDLSENYIKPAIIEKLEEL